MMWSDKKSNYANIYQLYSDHALIIYQLI